MIDVAYSSRRICKIAGSSHASVEVLPWSKIQASRPPDPQAHRALVVKIRGVSATDDLGNVTWEWTNEGDLQADDTLGAAERLRALVDPRLDVVDEDNPNEIKHNAKGLVKGYDPYRSGALGKQSWKKKKNLRELSKWIELKRKMEQKKEGE